MCRKMMPNYSTLGKVDTAILQQSVQNTRLTIGGDYLDFFVGKSLLFIADRMVLNVV